MDYGLRGKKIDDSVAVVELDEGSLGDCKGYMQL